MRLYVERLGNDTLCHNMVTEQAHVSTEFLHLGLHQQCRGHAARGGDVTLGIGKVFARRAAWALMDPLVAML